ncbi:MAG TPA: prepilin-type N-terminal cleavage/methylation domain-containing protein [Acidimicrobiales bacterium]|jgi:prepilin-type N-terminal cleavage/methylation domain-containing protein|nr:prepilin-type N-terminal cleavage/methylation domain-containing protein [Acidimicrobiales bacterium]
MHRSALASDRRDSGFTLVEVSIAALLAAIVGTIMMSVLVSAQQSERHLEEISASQEELRRAIVEVLQDIRSAEPLWFDAASSPAPAPGSEIRVVHRRAGSTQPTYIRWHIEGTDLVRDVVSVDGFNQLQTVARTYRLAGVDPLVTSFAYDDKSARATFASDAPVDWRKLNQCTVRVTVVLRAAPLRGRHPVSVTSEAQLRNNAEPPVFCPR